MSPLFQARFTNNEEWEFLKVGLQNIKVEMLQNNCDKLGNKEILLYLVKKYLNGTETLIESVNSEGEGIIEAIPHYKTRKGLEYLEVEYQTFIESRSQLAERELWDKLQNIAKKEEDEYPTPRTAIEKRIKWYREYINLLKERYLEEEIIEIEEIINDRKEEKESKI